MEENLGDIDRCESFGARIVLSEIRVSRHCCGHENLLRRSSGRGREWRLTSGAMISLGRVPPDVSICLFRVLQEALHNGVMHSGVQKFSVQLWGESEEVHLKVSDSGVGFDLRAARSGRGLGLVRIEQRVKLVNGTSSIDSQLEKGTTVHVSVPLRSGLDSLRAAD